MSQLHLLHYGVTADLPVTSSRPREAWPDRQLRLFPVIKHRELKLDFWANAQAVFIGVWASDTPLRLHRSRTASRDARPQVLAVGAFTIPEPKRYGSPGTFGGLVQGRSGRSSQNWDCRLTIDADGF